MRVGRGFLLRLTLQARQLCHRIRRGLDGYKNMIVTGRRDHVAADTRVTECLRERCG